MHISQSNPVGIVLQITRMKLINLIDKLQVSEVAVCCKSIEELT